MSTEESHQHLKAVNANTTEKELVEIYKTWSETYDKDVTDDLAYAAPKYAVEQLSEKLKEWGLLYDAHIIDLGCGTGLVGEELHKHGYKNVDGVDISPESLEIAKSKNVYRTLHCGYMASEGCKDLGININQYDAAICIGVFTIGHVKGKGFEDLIHVVKPGGLACFTIRDCVANDPQYEYNAKMDELSKQKKWKLIAKHHIVYHQVNNFKSWLYLYEIL